jgi:hypothetical protein
MRFAHGVTAAAVAITWICGAAPAQAYRPFDGTDAAVADKDQLEIELGPAEYLRQGSERTLFAPDTRFNYGFAPGWEAVVEGQVGHSRSKSIRSVAKVRGVRWSLTE